MKTLQTMTKATLNYFSTPSHYFERYRLGVVPFLYQSQNKVSLIGEAPTTINSDKVGVNVVPTLDLNGWLCWLLPLCLTQAVNPHRALVMSVFGCF